MYVAVRSWTLLSASSISEISMEVAEPGHVTAARPPAHLIERCDCPPGYAGLSCEVSQPSLTCLSSVPFQSQMGVLPKAPVHLTSMQTRSLCT